MEGDYIYYAREELGDSLAWVGSALHRVAAKVRKEAQGQELYPTEELAIQIGRPREKGILIRH